MTQRFVLSLIVPLLLLVWGVPMGSAQQLAFPTAEGFGRFAHGGRTGSANDHVCFVTNTNNSGAGSLRNCLEGSWTDGRFVIFRTGGTITLSSQITITDSNLTIAGQTAPGEGIMIKNYAIYIDSASHLIIRHLRVRPGMDSGVANHGSINVQTNTAVTRNLIIDHCSFSFTSGDSSQELVENVTYQYNIYAYGLQCNGDFGGNCDNKGLSAKGNNASVLRNVFSHMLDRTPHIMGGDTGGGLDGTARSEYINNVVHNHGPVPTIAHPFGPGPLIVDMLGNHHQHGNDGHTFNTYFFVDDTFSSVSSMFWSGNISHFRANNTLDEYADVQDPGNIPHAGSRQLSSGATVLTAAEAFTLATGSSTGAYKPVRDAIDAEAISDVINGTGTLIQYPIDMGGYPSYSAGTPCTDNDSDGICDSWEATHGLNSSDATDAFNTAANGYYNLENYLNELAGDTINGEPPPAPRGPRAHHHFRQRRN